MKEITYEDIKKANETIKTMTISRVFLRKLERTMTCSLT